MKKIFCALLMMFAMCPVSWSASEDMSVYVRQDVFDAKMETLFLRLHSEIENLGTRLEGKIDALSERIDGLEKRMDVMDKRIDEGLSGVNKRIDDTHNFLYLILVLLGVMLAVPFINKYWDFHKAHRTPFTTVEDVKRLITEAIAENNAKIRA